jgi:hypothetical protein
MTLALAYKAVSNLTTIPDHTVRDFLNSFFKQRVTNINSALNSREHVFNRPINLPNRV